MRVMRKESGHWPEGGFGANVLIALCAQHDPFDPTFATRSHVHIKERGAMWLNVLIACAMQMVW